MGWPRGGTLPARICGAYGFRPPAGDIEIGSAGRPQPGTSKAPCANSSAPLGLSRSMPALETRHAHDPPGMKWMRQLARSALSRASPGLLLDFTSLRKLINCGFDASPFLVRFRSTGRLLYRRRKTAGPDRPISAEALDGRSSPSVPDPVYDLLAEVAAAYNRPVTVFWAGWGYRPGRLLERARSCDAAVAAGRRNNKKRCRKTGSAGSFLARLTRRGNARAISSRRRLRNRIAGPFPADRAAVLKMIRPAPAAARSLA